MLRFSYFVAAYCVILATLPWIQCFLQGVLVFLFVVVWFVSCCFWVCIRSLLLFRFGCPIFVFTCFSALVLMRFFFLIPPPPPTHRPLKYFLSSRCCLSSFPFRLIIAFLWLNWRSRPSHSPGVPEFLCFADSSFRSPRGVSFYTVYLFYPSLYFHLCCPPDVFFALRRKSPCSRLALLPSLFVTFQYCFRSGA